MENVLIYAAKALCFSYCMQLFKCSENVAYQLVSNINIDLQLLTFLLIKQNENAHIMYNIIYNAPTCILYTYLIVSLYVLVYTNYTIAIFNLVQNKLRHLRSSYFSIIFRNKTYILYYS